MRNKKNLAFIYIKSNKACLSHPCFRKCASVAAVPTKLVVLPSALTSGTHAKLINLPIFSVILVVGHGVHLSLSTAKWEISVKQCKVLLNVPSIVFSDVLCTVLDVVMASTIA